VPHDDSRLAVSEKSTVLPSFSTPVPLPLIPSSVTKEVGVNRYEMAS
jgi:hypothetical protein